MATTDTKKKGSFILYAVIFIAVIFIIYQVVKNRKPKDKFPPQVQDTISSSTASNPAPSPDYDDDNDEPTAPRFDSNKVLKKGSQGEEVRYLQNALNRVKVLKGLPTIAVDGKFGPKTEESVQNFMKSKSTTYAKVKAAVIGTFQAAGQPNPYNESIQTAGNAVDVPWLPWM